jgi:hypothetical protein
MARAKQLRSKNSNGLKGRELRSKENRSGSAQYPVKWQGTPQAASACNTDRSVH